jgi:UDP-2,4-diacetamido-2,4,6-trideoxy-beta-L-altropyranose hydrolase
VTVESPPVTRVAIRADASSGLGNGHVMRCLGLAEALLARGAQVFLLSRELPQPLERHALALGVRVLPLPPLTGSAVEPAGVPLAPPDRSSTVDLLNIDEEDDARACLAALDEAGGANRLVVDHYGLSERFERAMRAGVPWIGVIDDLADRPHDCEVLLDQNLPDDVSARYASLVSSECTLLLGPRHALVREEFLKARRSPEPRAGAVREIVVSMGGMDLADMTSRALEGLASIDLEGVTITVIAGAGNPHLGSLAQACDSLDGARLIVEPDNMAELVAQADLAIGAAGTSTWERCLLGLPSILLSAADNQLRVGEALAAAGGALYLGKHPSADAIATAVAALLADEDRLRLMGLAARACMTGARGCRASEFVMRVMAGQEPYCLRPLAPADESMVLEWRNSLPVRQWMLRDSLIPAEEHHSWFQWALNSDDVLPWVFEADSKSSGLLYLGDVDWVARTCQWGFYMAPEGPRGVGEVMCRLGLAEAFRGAKLRTIQAEVIVTNDRSLLLHDRLGFRRTGVRHHERPSGAVDVLLFELHDSEWWRFLESGA